MGLANLGTDVVTQALATSGVIAAGQTTQELGPVDMTGFDAVQFEVTFGNNTSGAVITLQAEDCATSGGTYANCGAALVITDSGGATAYQTAILDVIQPQQRYVKIKITRGTQNSVLNAVNAHKYRARSKPIINDSTNAGTLVTECTS